MHGVVCGVCTVVHLLSSGRETSLPMYASKPSALTAGEHPMTDTDEGK